MFQDQEITKIKEKDKKKALEHLKLILDYKNKNLITVFRLDSEGDGRDIEYSILRAFLKKGSKKGHYENLKLALKWNRIDLAKTEIFTGDEEFKPEQLFNLMQIALIENKPQFVELLLENGVDLNSYLKTRNLYYLYNSHYVINFKIN